uniref:Uncharacterized protein n=1 Tax=Avena sativa TaxID=4498 RepID=A0ACD5YAI8_AVESA
MAELASGAVSSLLGLLRKEALLLSQVGSDSEFIKEEMESMHSFLEHLARTEPPAGGGHDEQVRTWMKQVRDLAHDCSNCIDLYIRRGDPAVYRARAGRWRYLWWASWLVQRIVAQHNTAIQLRKLTERAREVGNRRLRYGVEIPRKEAPSSSQAATTEDEEDDQNQADLAPDGSDPRQRGLEPCDLEEYCAKKLANWLKLQTKTTERGSIKSIAIVSPDDTEDAARASLTLATANFTSKVRVNLSELHLPWDLPLLPEEILIYILHECEQQQGTGQGEVKVSQEQVYRYKENLSSRIRNMIDYGEIDKRIDEIINKFGEVEKWKTGVVDKKKVEENKCLGVLLSALRLLQMAPDRGVLLSSEQAIVETAPMLKTQMETGESKHQICLDVTQYEDILRKVFPANKPLQSQQGQEATASATTLSEDHIKEIIHNHKITLDIIMGLLPKPQLLEEGTSTKEQATDAAASVIKQDKKTKSGSTEKKTGGRVNKRIKSRTPEQNNESRAPEQNTESRATKGITQSRDPKQSNECKAPEQDSQSTDPKQNTEIRDRQNTKSLDQNTESKVVEGNTRSTASEKILKSGVPEQSTQSRAPEQSTESIATAGITESRNPEKSNKGKAPEQDSQSTDPKQNSEITAEQNTGSLDQNTENKAVDGNTRSTTSEQNLKTGVPKQNTQSRVPEQNTEGRAPEKNFESRFAFKKGKFQHLKYFRVEDSKMIKITFESGAGPELKKISLSLTNKGSELTGVGGLPKLKEVELKGDKFLLSLFNSAHQIAKVTLCDTQLNKDDIQILAKKRNMHCLELSEKSYDESHLAFNKDEFPNLDLLIVQCPTISSISFTEGSAPKIEKIVWSFAEMKSLSDIDYLPRLKAIECSGNYVPHQTGVPKQNTQSRVPEQNIEGRAPEKNFESRFAFKKGKFQHLKYFRVEDSKMIKITFESGAGPELKKIALFLTNKGSELTGVGGLPKLKEVELKGDKFLLSLFNSAHQIAKVTLCDTQLNKDDIQILAKKRNMRCLELSEKSYDESHLAFNKDEFPNLDLLIVQCPTISSISFTEGSAPKIEKIVWSFAEMKSLSDIDYLPRLKAIECSGNYVPHQVRKDIAAHKAQPVFIHKKPQQQGQAKETSTAEEDDDTCFPPIYRFLKIKNRC